MANNRINYSIGFNVDQSGLTKVKASLQELKNLTAGDLAKINFTGLDEAERDLKKIKSSANELESVLKRSFNQDLGTLNLTKFNQELNKINLKDIYRDFNRAGEAGRAAFRNISTEILTTNLQIKNSNKFLDDMASTMKNTVKWGVASSVMNNFTNSVQQAYGYVKHLDSSLNDIRIVTGYSADEMDRFAAKANKAAKELAASTTDYTEASLIYYQQGLSGKEVDSRAETTLKAANVTGQSAAEVSEQLTAVWNGYKVSAEETEMYVDKLAAVAATTASDLEELSTGMSKVASAAAISGVDMDQLGATLSTVISVTRQAPESIGTAFKTIYARLGDLAVDGEDEFGVKLGEVSSKLKTMGIDILDSEGQMREMGTVVEEVAAKWDTWSSAQKEAAAVAMAGKRQYNNLMALFDNWDMYESALATSQNSLGTLSEQQEIYLDSAEAKLQQLKTAQEGLYDSLLDADTIKAVAETLTGVFSGFESFVDGIGGGSTALMGFGAIVTQVFGRQLSQGLNTTIQNFAKMRSNMEQMKAAPLAIDKMIKQLGEDIDVTTLSVLKLSKELHAAGGALSPEEFNEVQKLIEKYNEAATAVERYNDKKERVSSNLSRLTEGNIGEEEVDKIDKAGSKAYIQGLGADVAKSKGEYEKIASALKTVAETQDNTINAVSQYRQALRQLNGDVELTKDKETELATVIGTQKEAILKSAKAITTSDIVSPIKDDLLDAIIEYEKFEDKGSEVAEELMKKIANLSDRAAQEIKEDVAEARRDIEQMAEGTGAKLKQEAETTGKNIGGALKNIDTAKLSQSIVGVLGGVEQLGFGLMSLSNIFKILEDDTLSYGEKTTQIIMAISAGIPMLIMGISTTVSGLTGLATAVNATAMAGTAGFGAITTAVNVLGKALLKNPIFWVGAAILGIVAAVKLWEKHMDRFNKQAEKSAKVADKMKTALGDAQTALGELNTELDDLKNKQDALDGLTKGTQEWNDKLRESNEAVLELINKYPELAKYVATDSDGVIRFSDEGIQELKNRKQQEIVQKQNAVTSANIQANDDQIAANEEKIRQEINKETDVKIDSALNQEVINKIKDVGAGITKEDLKEIEGLTNGQAEAIVDALPKILGLLEKNNALEQTNEINKDEIAKQVFDAANTTEENRKDERYQDTTNLIYDKEYQKAETELKGKTKDEVIDEFLELNPDLRLSDKGGDGKGDKDTAKFTDVSGEKEFNYNFDEMVSAVASNSALNDAADKLDRAAEHLLNIKEKPEVKDLDLSGDIGNAILSGGVNNKFEVSDYLTEDDINKIANKNYTAEQLGVTKEMANEAGYTTAQGYVDAFMKEIKEKSSASTKEEGPEDGSKNLSVGGGKNSKGEIERSIYQADAHASNIEVRQEVEGLAAKNALASITDDADLKLINQAFQSGKDLNQIAEEGGVNGTKFAEETAQALKQLVEEGSGGAFEELAKSEYQKLKDGTGRSDFKPELGTFTSSGEYSKEDLDQWEITDDEFKKIKAEGNFSEKEIAEKNTEFALGVKKDGKDLATEFSKTKEEAQELAEIYEKKLLKGEKSLSKEEKELLKNNKQFTKAYEDRKKDTKDLTKRHFEMTNGLQEVVDNEEKWSKALAKEKKGTKEQAKAMDGMRGAMSKILGVNKNLIKDSLLTADNLELASKAAQGDAESLRLLQLESAKDYVTNLELEDNATKKAKDILTNLSTEFKDKPIVTEAELKASKYYKQLDQMRKSGQITASQMNNALGQIGFKPKITWKNVKFEIPSILAKVFGKKAVNLKIPQMSMEKGASNIGGNVDPAGGGGADDNSTGGSGGSGDKGGSGGGGGGGSGSTPTKEYKESEKEKDRYRTVNNNLSKLTTQLERLADVQDRLYGKQLLDNLNKQLNIIQKQKNTLKEKLNIARAEAKEMRKSIANQKPGYKNDLKDFGVKFNNQGEITNYNSIMSSLDQKVQSYTNKWNSMTAKQQEADKKKKNGVYAQLEKAEANRSKFQELIEKYDTLIYDTIPGLEDELTEALYQEIEIKLQKFNLEAEIRLDLTEAIQDWADFKKEMNEYDFYAQGFGGEASQLVKDSSISERKLYETVQSGIGYTLQQDTQTLMDELVKMQSSNYKGQFAVKDPNTGEYVIDEIAVKEAVENNLESLQEYAISIKEATKEAFDNMMEAIDGVDQAYDRQYEVFDFVRGQMESALSMFEMIEGDLTQSAGTGKLEEIKDLYDDIYTNAKQSRQTAQQEMAYWESIMNDTSRTQAEREAAAENYRAAADKLQDALAYEAEVVQKQFELAIDEQIAILNKYLDFPSTSAKWELEMEIEDDYLDTINAAFGKQEFINKVQASINETDSLSAQKRLNKLRDEELAKLREKDKLTQYDLDRANQMLEIELKRIALEEAQLNKSQMRLRRDASGNYSYQFVANEEDQRKAQEELAASQKNLYDLDKENLKNLQNEFAESGSRIADIMNEFKALSPDEQAAQWEDYEAKLNYEFERQKELALQIQETQKNLAQSAFNSQKTLYETNPDAFAGMSEDALNLLGKEFKDLTEEEIDFILKEWAPSSATTLDDMISKVLDPVYEDTQKEILENVKNSSDAYGDSLDAITEEVVNTYESGAEAAENWTKKNEDLIESFKEAVTQTQQIYDNCKKIEQSLDAQLRAVKEMAETIGFEYQNYLKSEANGVGGKTPDKSDETLTLTEEYKKGVAGAIYTFDDDGWGVGNKRKQKLTDVFGNGAASIVDKEVERLYNTNADLVASRYKKYKYQYFDTGGYTGKWGKDGKLAVLHEKELVLNAADTRNILEVISIVRDLVNQKWRNMTGFNDSEISIKMSTLLDIASQILNKVAEPKELMKADSFANAIAEAIEEQSLGQVSRIGSILSSVEQNIASIINNAVFELRKNSIASDIMKEDLIKQNTVDNQVMQQQITINADFPNATSADEIYKAFESLENIAGQRAFGDSYEFNQAVKAYGIR